MHLRSLCVKNYLSLEGVELDGLGQFNGPAMAKLITKDEVPGEVKTVIEALLAQLPG
jgi:hypothetical protein